MSKIAYFAIPNPTGTAADAPALPRVIPNGVAKGQYWLVVTTFGLIGELTPCVFRKPVTLVEAIDIGPFKVVRAE